MSETAITRRELLRRGGGVGGALALPMLLHSESSSGVRRSAAASSSGLRPGADVYQSIGVRPLINARGTYTIISGSLMLPEVRAAIEAAAQHYVHLDELAEAIGARLAELTKAEWGMVTSGCAAALTHATAACVAGGNPDLHVRIPDLRGFPRTKRSSRSTRGTSTTRPSAPWACGSSRSDHGRARGRLWPAHRARLHLRRTRRRREPAEHASRSRGLAQARGVPVLVDAAAEVLTVPNVHLQHGATLVGYSGGKCLRGPQTAGLLLGTQGPRAGRLGPQRAASRLRPRHEGRQGRSDRHADGGRDVDEARPRGRVEPVDRLARPHRDAASPRSTA